jgi:hypothetical protein
MTDMPTMGRISYLIGVSGAGKGFVADRLRREVGGLGIITGDLVLHHAAIRLCPYLKAGHAWSWDLWNALSADCDLRSALSKSIQDLASAGALPSPAHGKFFLAEATLFGLNRVRGEFHAALTEAGFALGASTVAWLDVPPEEVMERVRRRDRANERWIDMDEIQKRHRQYMDCAPVADFRSHDTDETASAIREFLLDTP